MEFTTPAPMVWDTATAIWPTDIWPTDMDAAVMAPLVDYPSDFKPVREWPVFGLRPLELAALRFLHREGPIFREDFYRRFKGATPKGRAAILHDLNRLYLIRLIEGSDAQGKSRIMIQLTGEPDFADLERTSCV